jgi:hypothetical protein
MKKDFLLPAQDRCQRVPASDSDRFQLEPPFYGYLVAGIVLQGELGNANGASRQTLQSNGLGTKLFEFLT